MGSRSKRFVSEVEDCDFGFKTNGNPDLIVAILEETTDKIADLKTGVLKECERNKALNDTWKQAIKNYNNRKSSHHGVPVEFHYALWTYTLDGFYDEFNSVTRNLRRSHDVNSYPFKSYFKLLFLAIIEVKGNPYNVPRDMKLYRGVSGKNGYLAVESGSRFFLQQFISTTTNRDVATKFANSGGYPILLVISGIVESGHTSRVMLNSRDAPNVVGMSDHSKFPEEEMLIWPAEGFTVKDVRKDRNLQVVYLQA